MIEAMACGTPIITCRRGSIPEVVDEGVTGFVVDTVEEAIAAVGRVGEIDRGGVRQRFEERFGVARMAEDYLGIYEQMIEERAASVSPVKERPWKTLFASKTITTS